MSYQAVIRNGSGILVSSSPVGIRINILQGSISGPSVFTETHSPNSNANGLVSLEIGGGTLVSGDFSTIDWSGGPYFVKTETDPLGGTSYTITGTSQLLSVPYALHAKTAENGFSGDYNDLTNTPTNVSTFTNDAGYLTSFTEVDADTTNEIQNIAQVLVIGNDADSNSLVNVSQLGVGTSTPNVESSIHVTTALPIIFPSMTQAQVNAITAPVEGMVQFNTDAHKLQVYAMLTNNTSILNEIFMGTTTGGFSGIVDQNLTSPIAGQVIAVELLLEDFGGGFPFIDMLGQGSFTVPSFGSFTWFTFVLPSPIPVSAGVPFNITFIGPGVDFHEFGTNSNYPNGSGCCFLGADDVLFRVHIQPTPGSFGWQNMH